MPKNTHAREEPEQQQRQHQYRNPNHFGVLSHHHGNVMAHHEENQFPFTHNQKKLPRLRQKCRRKMLKMIIFLN